MFRFGRATLLRPGTAAVRRIRHACRIWERDYGFDLVAGASHVQAEYRIALGMEPIAQVLEFRGGELLGELEEHSAKGGGVSRMGTDPTRTDTDLHGQRRLTRTLW